LINSSNLFYHNVVKTLFGWIFNIFISGFKLFTSLIDYAANFQLLLKLEILDKLRLVASHKYTTQRNVVFSIGSNLIGETGILLRPIKQASLTIVKLFL
jgi:hypothetical protein